MQWCEGCSIENGSANARAIRELDLNCCKKYMSTSTYRVFRSRSQSCSIFAAESPWTELAEP